MTRLIQFPRLGDELFDFAPWSDGLQCFRLTDNGRPMRRICFDRQLIDSDPPHGISGLVEVLFDLAEHKQDIGVRIARRERIPPKEPVNYNTLIEELRAWANEIPPSSGYSR